MSPKNWGKMTFKTQIDGLSIHAVNYKEIELQRDNA